MFSADERIQFFESALFESLGKETQIQSFEFVSGGDINTAVKLISNQGVFFLKWNVWSLEGMFEAEAKGLELLKKANEIHIPEIIAYGKIQDKAYLIVEFIYPSKTKNNFWENFGTSLAKLHRHTNPLFGLDFNNYIGSLPQYNGQMKNGIDFFIEKRLKTQVGLALYKNKINKETYRKFEKLYEKLPNLIPDEKPALLHGDLWTGNFLLNQYGEVSLIDPAVYYGNREAEIAFTQLFGGFNEAFYTAYQLEYPLEKDFDKRVEIYNLYPLLVHLNLFGSGYLSAIERVLRRYGG